MILFPIIKIFLSKNYILNTIINELEISKYFKKNIYKYLYLLSLDFLRS